MKKLIIIAAALLFLSCSKEEILKQPTILVIGNSITECPSGGEWKGNWGMASTSKENDFCSLVEKGFEAKLDRKNIAVWENNFNCGTEHYYLVTSIKYDYVILKIGENVSDLVNFKSELQKLTDYYSNYTDNIVLVSTVWAQYDFDEFGNPFEVPSDKDRIISEIALENDYVFVDISQMKTDSSNYAWGEYEDSGISAHPSDKGMKFIANKIIEKINEK